MFVFFATIAATVFAADPDASTSDIYARLGMPKLEKCDYRIHVGKGGKWTIRITQLYGVKGVTAEDLNDFDEDLIDEATDIGARSFSRSGAGENRRQCVSKGRSEDLLKLASLLTDVFAKRKCDFCRLDRESFEWRFLREEDNRSSGNEKKTVGELVAGMALDFFLTAAIEHEFSKKGVTQAEMESLMQEAIMCQLVVTTDGKITADSPAKVSENGKTMTLDLTKFLSAPREKWSIRIDGL